MEIEFYLQDFTNIKSLEQDIGIRIEEEKGQDQYEIDIGPCRSMKDVIERHQRLTQQISTYVHNKGGKAIFTAKPFIEDYGNGMHIHVNFLSENGENLFDHEDNLIHAMRAMCHFTPENLNLFLFNSEHFARINSRKMNPTNISMGKNNRTTMLRVPPTLPKRIEHRLAAPDNNLTESIYLILDAIYKGLESPQRITKFDIIYGNAFDEQYQCKKLT